MNMIRWNADEYDLDGNDVREYDIDAYDVSEHDIDEYDLGVPEPLTLSPSEGVRFLKTLCEGPS